MTPEEAAEEMNRIRNGHKLGLERASVFKLIERARSIGIPYSEIMIEMEKVAKKRNETEQLTRAIKMSPASE